MLIQIININIHLIYLIIAVCVKDYILCVYTYCMGQIDIYIKDDDKIKLVRKASKMRISVSKLMVRAALEYEPRSKECEYERGNL